MAIHRIAVFGATGTQGHPVVDAGLDAGLSVRAVSRDPEAAEQKLSARVEVVEADLNDADSVTAALEGMEGVFFHLPAVPDSGMLPAMADNVLDGARSAGIKRLVFTTGAHCGELMPAGALVDGLRKVSAAILDSGVPAVVLRPTLYLANLVWPHLISEIRDFGRLSYPPLDPDRRVSWTATEDQGRIAVACMNADVAGQTLDIASPEPVTGAELARMLAGVYGREVHFAPQGLDEFGGDLAAMSGSGDFGRSVAELYEGINRMPPEGLIIDTGPIEEKLDVELIPVSCWVRDYYGRLLELYG